VKGGPLVVVGDSLLDVDLEGTAGRLAPDAPVPVVDCHRERHRAGGAGLAAVLAARMAPADVVLITAIAADSRGARLRDLLSGHVQVLPVPMRGSTPSKIRVRASGQPVVRLDAGDGRACAGPADPAAERALRAAGAVLVADYGRGMTAHPGLRAALTRLGSATPVVWDPHPRGEPPVRGIRLATPNQSEARGLAGALGYHPPGPGAREPRRPGPDAPGLGAPVSRAARDAMALSRAWGTGVAVTLGRYGALLSVGDDTPFMAQPPAPGAGARADTCGAGDCFAAAAAQVIRAGGLLTEAVVEAVRCASGFVGAGGAAAAPALVIPGEKDFPAGRPPTAGQSAWDIAAGVRGRGGRIVATGGCFDLLHAGHVGLLRAARRLGDCLIVCLNSDSSVRALKGPGRPLTGAQDRSRVLAALECVDAVLIFDERTPAAVLERLRPDVWVKGGDYAHAELAEAAVIRGYGGEVVLLPYSGRHSTSRIVAAARSAAAAAGTTGRGA
jgi:rfaE bifunctional protein nucleotidyltransferase chain/domain